MSKLIFEKESYAIRGAAFEVYKELGAGFWEAIDQETLEKEFTSKKIPFESQKPLEISYKGETLEKRYFVDYLKATKFKLGFLINFGGSREVEIKRIVN